MQPNCAILANVWLWIPQGGLRPREQQPGGVVSAQEERGRDALALLRQGAGAAASIVLQYRYCGCQCSGTLYPMLG